MAKHNKRREVLRAIGFGAVASVAGCIGDIGGGGGGGGGGGSQDKRKYLDEAKNVGFSDNWQQRRIGSEKWSPPEGWKDTIAADVDQIQILNHGSLDYDPATKMLGNAFQEATGIKVKYQQISSTTAIPKKQALLSAGQSSPVLMDMFPHLEAASHISSGHLEISDPLAPPGNKDMWNPYQPAARNAAYSNLWKNQSGNHMLGAPKILEGSLLHVRPDLLKKQGVDPKPFLEATHTWGDLEEVMEAFKGTDIAGYAFYGSQFDFVTLNFLEMLYEQGGRVVQNGKVVVNGSPHVRATKKQVEWMNKGWVPESVVNYGQGNLADLFLSGDVAMVPVMGDLGPEAREAFGKDSYKPTLLPKATSGPSPAHAGVYHAQNLAMNKNAPPKAKVASLLYGDLRMSYEASWAEFVDEGNMAYINQVYDDAANEVPNADIFKQAISNNVLEIVPQSRVVFQKLGDEIMKALAGDQSPKKAHDTTQEYIDQVLNQ